MSFVTFLNKWCRKTGVIVMFLLPLIIIILAVLGNFDPSRSETLLAALVWVLLFINSLAYTLNGYIIAKTFKKETKKRAEKGFPVDSMEGFHSVDKFTRDILTSSSLISIIVAISLALFTSAILINSILDMLALTNTPLGAIINQYLRDIIKYSSIGLVFIAIGILMLLQIPDEPIFKPGAMLKYYTPRSTPLVLDNLLSDSVTAFLDPMTRIRMDEWTDSIRLSLNESFESDETPTTRLERAREKILLLFYLHLRMPLLVTEQQFDGELGEVIKKSQVDDFKNGVNSGISFKILSDIMKRLMKNMPEVFTVIDRLVIELTDNLPAFRDNEDVWVTVSSPEKIIGNKKPFRALFFVLNKNYNDYANKRRPVTFTASGANGSFLENFTLTTTLDEAEDELQVKVDKLPFLLRDGDDVVGLLQTVLQVGDAVWFTFDRSQFKSHLIWFSLIEGDRGAIFGETAKVDISRDLMFYVKTYGGKLSALAGLAVPAYSFIMNML